MGLPYRHGWVLHPMASRGVPRFSCLLLAPNQLNTRRSVLSLEYVHVGLNLSGISCCRGPPPLKLPTAPASNMGRKGRLFYPHDSCQGAKWVKEQQASHASAPQEEHQSEERGFPLAL